MSRHAISETQNKFSFHHSQFLILILERARGAIALSQSPKWAITDDLSTKVHEYSE